MLPLIFYLTENGNLVTFLGKYALTFNRRYELITQVEKFELSFLPTVCPMVTFLHIGNLAACEGSGYIYLYGKDYFQDQTTGIWGKSLDLATNSIKYRLQIRRQMLKVDNNRKCLSIARTSRHTRGVLRTGAVLGPRGRTTLLRK